MATIQSLGVGSGLDVNSIITQLLAIERQPVTRLQRLEKDVETEISAYGNVRSKADVVGSAAEALADEDTWRKTSVNLNGADEFTVTTTGNASALTLDVEITALAQRQSISTKAFDASSSTVGTGVLTLQRGAWSAGFDGFTAAEDAPPVEITIGPGQDTLTGIRDAINAASAGVTASILTDSSGARLVIRSEQTGADHGFSITTRDATGEFDALGFTAQRDPASAAGAQGNTRATNLQGRVDGAPVESATNTLGNVLPGITIRASKTTASPRTVSIEHDRADIRTKIDAFVTAFNDLMSYIKAQTAYNESTKTPAALQGDRAALLVQSQFRGLATGTTQASQVFTRLSDVGISLQADGRLKVDDGKLNEALEDLEEVASLFGRDEAGTAEDGLALRLAEMVDQLTSPDGAIERKQSTLRDRLKRNQDEQARLEERVADVEKRLRAQYTALDSKMSKLNGLGSYVAQQFGNSK
jgi:flagellar hook-associated protein 2